MEEGVLSPGTLLGAPSDCAMDFEYMDELLLEGCWLETTDGSEFLNPCPSSSAALLDPSFLWCTPEINDVESGSSPSRKGIQEIDQASSSPDNLAFTELEGKSPVNTQSLSHSMANATGLGNDATEDSEKSRRWWIGPNPGPGTSVRERLIRALWYINDLTKDKDSLVQIWVPVNRGSKQVLTTRDQPFALDPSCQRLASYRDISVKYQFSAEEGSKELLGLPGRVFLGKVPEWSPDVRFFRSDEYPRVDHAQQCDVRGSLALPVFEQGSRTCLGVIEVVTTAQKVKCRRELESVCKALEAVDLKTSEVLSTRNVKACDMSYEAALAEILEVLRPACETHSLPLAQTWVPCIQQGKGGCRHSDDNYYHCVSTVDHACYVADPVIKDFHEACSEHHLLIGQGVAGQAFLTNQPCFSSDITSLGKTEYPLSHHARMFRLRAAVAIRLRSVHTGAADFVLEFFLPADCKDIEEQKEMLTSLSTIIQKVCRTLRVVSDKELKGETSFPVSGVVIPSESRPCTEENLRLTYSHPETYAGDNSSRTACLNDIQPTGTDLSCQKQKQRVMSSEQPRELRKNQEDGILEGSTKCGGDSTFAEGSFSSVCTGKTGEKRRTKAEKTIGLEVLQQYFAGSLKDAAKSIGVCPTTLKRICRQHGIKRWPSRKLQKVDHSLQKLQLVIDSVQGASGPLKIGSFYTDFPKLSSPNLSRTSPFSNSKPRDHPELSSIQPEGSIFSCQVAAPKSPSSSRSQSSSSSQCCSNGTQHPSPVTVAASEDAVFEENFGNIALKRVKSVSVAELHVSSQEECTLLPKSHSDKSLTKQPNLGNFPTVPKNGGQVSQEVDARRVKVTYGEEIIRFRMPNYWRFQDLVQEIARRFNIDAMSRFQLRYLDDDSDWVLLSCDDDLEECVDVCRSSQSNTIKLSLETSLEFVGRSSSSCVFS